MDKTTTYEKQKELLHQKGLVSMWTSVVVDHKEIGSTEPDENIKLSDLFHIIRSDKYKANTEYIRKCEYKSQEYNDAKKSLPWFTGHGVFKGGRLNSQLQSHSLVFWFDLDGGTQKNVNPQEVRRNLEKDEYLHALFQTGHPAGLKFCVRIDAEITPQNHNQLYDQAFSFIEKRHSIQLDKAQKKLSQAIFIFWDQAAFYKIDSKPLVLGKVVSLPATAKQQSKICSENNLESVFDLCEYLAQKEHGEFEPGKNAHNYIFHLASALNQFGVRQVDTESYVHNKYKHFTDNPSNAISGPYDTYKDQFGRQEFKLKLNTDPSKTFYKVERFCNEILQTYKVRYNELSGRYEIGGKHMADREENSLRYEALKTGIDISKEEVRSIIRSPFVDSYNPLIEYFESREPATKKGLISALAASVIQTTYTPEVWEVFLTKWLVGCVASIYPENMNLLNLVFSGEQNNGKSHFFEFLVPKSLQDYYIVNQLDKEPERLMCSSWIICDDEYSGKNKMEVAHLKFLSSQRRFTFRRPYEANPVTMPRIASLCGTSNENELLADTTGNRRLIPVAVLYRDFDKYDAIDKNELWSEVFALYESGYYWQLSKEDIRILNRSTSEFERFSQEHDLAIKYTKKTDKALVKDDGTGFIFSKGVTFEAIANTYLHTAGAISAHIKQQSGVNISNVQLGKELRRIGYQQYYGRIKGNKGRYYLTELVYGD